MAESCYLRYPHAARDLVTFAAQDDVWLASLSEAASGRGARAWRLRRSACRLSSSGAAGTWTEGRRHGTVRDNGFEFLFLSDRAGRGPGTAGRRRRGGRP